MTIMQKKIFFIIKQIVYKVNKILFTCLRKLIRNRNVIILGTYSDQIYCENTRYLFEYLSKHTHYHVYWYTNNHFLHHYFEKKKLKYIAHKKWWQQIWLCLHAKIVIDSGTGYFNRWGMLSGDDIIKITTLHGSGAKVKATIMPTAQETLKEILSYAQFNFVNFPSRFSAEATGRDAYWLSEKKIINCGYPRCDQYFDAKNVVAAYEKKPLTQMLLGKKFSKDIKVIVYTPTWRPYKVNLPILDKTSIELINQILIEYNAYFFYAIHTMTHMQNLLNEHDRFIKIEREKFPLFDISQFFMEIDLLINDYSTTSTECAILKKPQIFYMPDYDKFLRKRGFVEEYKNSMPGPEAHTVADIISLLTIYLTSPNQYQENYSNKIKIYLEKYYDIKNTHACQQFTNFIETLI